MNGHAANLAPTPAATAPQIFTEALNEQTVLMCHEQLAGLTYDQMYKIWKDGGVQSPTVRQFMVARLTAPRTKLLDPSVDQAVGRILHIRDRVDAQPIDSLRERLDGRMDLADELVLGVSYWLRQGARAPQILQRSIGTIRDYQSVMLAILPIASEARADALFEYYTAFGFEALESLICDQDIPQKYRDTSLANLLQTAEEEPSIEIDSFRAYTTATATLVRIAPRLAGRYGATADKDSLLKIITLLEDCISAGTIYINGYDVAQVAQHIDDEDMRLKFAVRHITSDGTFNTHRFKIEHSADLSLANWTLNQVIERDMPIGVQRSVENVIDRYRRAMRAQMEVEAGRQALLATLRAAR